jgi:hypothetical protein
MLFLLQPAHAARLPARLAGISAAAAVLVLAPAFCGAVALANGPVTAHVPTAQQAGASSERLEDVANTDSAAPPVVVLLSKTELSRGPSQANEPVTLPMSFGQPVAPEDELAATPSPATRHHAANHRRQTHLATFSARVATDDGAEVRD